MLGFAILVSLLTSAMGASMMVSPFLPPSYADGTSIESLASTASSNGVDSPAPTGPPGSSGKTLTMTMPMTTTVFGTASLQPTPIINSVSNPSTSDSGSSMTSALVVYSAGMPVYTVSSPCVCTSSKIIITITSTGLPPIYATSSFGPDSPFSYPGFIGVTRPRPVQTSSITETAAASIPFKYPGFVGVEHALTIRPDPHSLSMWAAGNPPNPNVVPNSILVPCPGYIRPDPRLPVTNAARDAEALTIRPDPHSPGMWTAGNAPNPNAMAPRPGFIRPDPRLPVANVATRNAQPKPLTLRPDSDSPAMWAACNAGNDLDMAPRLGYIRPDPRLPISNKLARHEDHTECAGATSSEYCPTYTTTTYILPATAPSSASPTGNLPDDIPHHSVPMCVTISTGKLAVTAASALGTGNLPDSIPHHSVPISHAMSYAHYNTTIATSTVGAALPTDRLPPFDAATPPAEMFTGGGVRGGEKKDVKLALTIGFLVLAIWV